MGEGGVAQIMRQSGFSIIGRNIIFYGITEVDLLCNRANMLYAIEVKSCFHGSDQTILQVMTGRKRQRLRKGARLFNEYYCRGAYEIEMWLAICYFSPSLKLEKVKFLPLK